LRRRGVVRKVVVRLPGKGNTNSHGARPVHLIITMIKWIQTSRLSIKNSLSEHLAVLGREKLVFPEHQVVLRAPLALRVEG